MVELVGLTAKRDTRVLKLSGGQRVAVALPHDRRRGLGGVCALGFAVTAVIPNFDAAAPIVNATILPLLFLSGVFIPIGDNAPRWIVWVAKIFPVRHFAQGVQAGFVQTPFHWTDVLVVALWGLAGLLVAVRWFSWEPRT